MSIRWTGPTRSGSCSTITSPPIRWGRRAAWARRGGARSATGSSLGARSAQCCRPRPRGPLEPASSRRSPSQTGHPRWGRSAARLPDRIGGEVIVEQEPLLVGPVPANRHIARPRRGGGDTTAWVSPRVKSAEPCVASSAPTSARISTYRTRRCDADGRGCSSARPWPARCGTPRRPARAGK